MNFTKEDVQKIVRQVGSKQNYHLIAQTFYLNGYPNEPSEQELVKERVRDLAKKEGFIDATFSQDQSGKHLVTLYKTEDQGPP